uniref:Uncharacterized protein n=1 Tax=Callorhinchus milii TaxID=7868 RepID=A0A4W3GBL5_CALMI
KNMASTLPTFRFRKFLFIHTLISSKRIFQWMVLVSSYWSAPSSCGVVPPNWYWSLVSLLYRTVPDPLLNTRNQTNKQTQKQTRKHTATHPNARAH